MHALVVLVTLPQPASSSTSNNKPLFLKPLNFITSPTKALVTPMLLSSTKFITKLPQLSLLQYVATFTIPSSNQPISVETLTAIINDHPFPHQPLIPNLINLLPPRLISAAFVDNVLGCLFASHVNGLKALEFFKYCLTHSRCIPTSTAFEKVLHILVRMRYFEKAWELLDDIAKSHPELITLKSMSIMLSKLAKFQSFEDTLLGFERFETILRGKTFGTDELNALLGAFCSQRDMKEARAVFHKMYGRFKPNCKTMNILLLGFKESGDVTALELFYHDMVRRGFKPNIVTYNIRIDAYCKKGRLGDALRVFDEMGGVNLLPSLETLTTLIHGAGIARNVIKARQMFDEIPKRNLRYDVGAYNALISSLVRCRKVDSAISLMDEMEVECIAHDNMTYHLVFLGLMRMHDFEGFCELYQKMVQKNFVPKARTTVMLMKHFCVNRRIDLGLSLWKYLIEKGSCPHGHALDLLVTGLCSRGAFKEAFECSNQMLDRGMRISNAAYQMLERFSLENNRKEQLMQLGQKIEKLVSVLPPSRDRAAGYAGSVTTV